MTSAKNPIVLYQDQYVLIVQTTAQKFDKTSPSDLYGSYNLALHVKDSPSHVLQNRMDLLINLNQLGGGGIDEIVWLNQIHSDMVIDVDTADLRLLPDNADAMITRTAGKALAIMTADCVPITLFTPKAEQVACIHAGWQGLASGIIAKTAKQFDQTAKLHAIIGACIHQSSYEVDQVLANKIITDCTDQNLTKLSAVQLKKVIIKDSRNDKCLIDLVTLTKLQLAALDVNIMGAATPCTYQDERFYSYRHQTHHQKKATGRMATVIVRLHE
ncbi:polyphenol oxidase family protein [Moraxella nasovis]|uniref:polyphenol oxidase family protein n=1 Tax=Moraxella nasovis TaxID=2904121 RepID=UPI001F62270A|nr:polyphenol oxidase family protein [Moraxella nasovis]UNU73398.1 polyphenol oxidase family protein [Moraxella nasovis]